MTPDEPVAPLHQSHDYILYLENLIQTFRGRGGAQIRALDGVTLPIIRGETLGVVGESGCGKSTLARAAVLLRRPTNGRVVFEDQVVSELHGKRLRQHRQHVQMVFQDPNDSLDPRFTVRRSVSEPLRAIGVSRDKTEQRVAEVVAEVGLDSESLDRYPHEFSGGQRQRIAIARAIATRPRFVVLDEPTSALDVSIQAQILNLLRDLQAREQLTYMFISHNLGVVRYLAHRVAVMYLGRVVEVGPVEDIFTRPQHPYTAALLSAIPDPSIARRERIVLSGDVPSPTQRHAGCSFASRCWMAQDICRAERPALIDRSGSVGRQLSACHFAHEVPTPALGQSVPA